MSPAPSGRAAAGAWIIFDVANTVFWTGVVGIAFPLWIITEKSGDDATLGYTLSGTMAAVLVAAPILGAFSDHARRRMPMLLVTVAACASATLLLGNGGLLVSLALFAVALCAMELGTILYNALLVKVSTEQNRGTIAGLGIGIGFSGSFIAGVVVLLLTDHVVVFRVIALLFLLFSIPIITLLRERPRQVLPSSPLSRVRLAFSQLRRNLRSLHRFPGLRGFLAARFFYALAISTTANFAVVYAAETIGLGEREIKLILLAGISVAIPSGVAAGVMADRIGPRPVLNFGLLLWMAALMSAVAIPWLSLSRDLWWAVSCLTGAAMAILFTADRPYMLGLTPREYLGEFFGLHGMVGKAGRVVGPFMWAFISVTLGFGQPAAVVSLVGCLMVSYVMLSRMSAPERSLSVDLAD